MRSLRFGTWIAISLLLAASAAANPVSFESISDVSVGSDGAGTEITGTRTVTDGNGVWIIAWAERSYTSDYDLFYVRSTDDARTWSAPQNLNAGAATDDGAYDVDVSLAADVSGNWLAVWSTQDSLGDTIGSDYDVVYSRSSDNGLSWSAPLPVNSDAAVDVSADLMPIVRTDGAGMWMVIWRDEQLSSVALARSSDVGTNWSAAAAVAPLAASVYEAHELETDGSGNWVHVWGEHNEDGLFEIHSADNGLNWSSKQEIDDGFAIGNGPIGLATDGAGVWNVAFKAYASGATGYDLFSRRSFDGGASWSPRLPLDPGGEPAAGDFLWDVRLVHDAQSNSWVAAWTSEGAPFALSSELDVVYSQSFDAGLSWTRVATMSPHVHPDGVREMIFDLATDGAGTYVAAMGGRTVDDTGSHTQLMRAVSSPDCSPVPLGGCKSPTAAGKSVLAFGSTAGDDDSLIWKWARGDATDKLHFADPTTTANYGLCAYDSSLGTPVLVFEKDVLAGAQCATGACWAERSTGYRYTDRGRRITSVGTLDLKAGVAGKAKIKASAGGAALGPPVLPFAIDPALTMQLVNRQNGECWTASYSTFQYNTAGKYKARSDAP